MTETILRLVADWGVAAIAIATFLSCLALPVPASLGILAGGAFSATGDLDLGTAMIAALAGAVAGDQVGYQVGLRAGTAILGRVGRRGPVAEAQAFLDRRAGVAVFLSRWLLSPLGPWVNLAAGAARVGWARFTLPAVAGEAVWVAGYSGLGFAFGAQIERLAGVAGNIAGALAALAVAGGLFALAMRQRQGRRSRTVKRP